MSDQPPANPDDLRSAAREFASGTEQVRTRFQYLGNSIGELLSGADAWAGAGSQQFQQVWRRASQDARQATDALEHTTQVLNKFADAIEEVQHTRDWQIVAGVALGALTIFLTVADILQAGLDPVTDAATVTTAAAADAAFTAVGEGFVAAEEAAITGLETAAEMTPEVEGIAGDVSEIAGEGSGTVDLPTGEVSPGGPGEVPPAENPVGELPPEEPPPGEPGEVPPPQPSLSESGINSVEQHLSRSELDPSPTNDAMIARLRNAFSEGRPLTEAEKNFYEHELFEKQLMDQGIDYPTAHAEALRTYGVDNRALYDPEVIQEFPDLFNNYWRSYWGLPPR